MPIHWCDACKKRFRDTRFKRQVCPFCHSNKHVRKFARSFKSKGMVPYDAKELKE